MSEKLLFYKDLPKSLSNEEIRRLFIELKSGSNEAKELLINHNLRLVIHTVIRKFGSVDYDKKDLVQIGIRGLEKAVNTFDITKDVKFSSYSVTCITNEILMFLRKLKKDEKVDSLDRVIMNGPGRGDYITLADVISDKKDFTEEFEKKELYQYIREVVQSISGIDGEIIRMFFGFNGKVYNQMEIAKILNISQSYVSRKLSKTLKNIKSRLEEYGIETNQKEEEPKEIKRCKTLYELLGNYSREEVSAAIDKLKERDQHIIRLKYGEDLDNPKFNRLSETDNNRFKNRTVRNLKKILLNKNSMHVDYVNVKKTEKEDKKKDKKNDGEIKDFSKEEKDSISKEDYAKILNMLKTPPFCEILKTFSVKEAIVIALRLGYFDGKYYSTSTIANFLDISCDEVREITKRILSLYKENINEFLDNAIKSAVNKVNIK